MSRNFSGTGLWRNTPSSYGVADPTENSLINIANDFAEEFDELAEKVIEAMDKSLPIDRITEESLVATRG